MRTSTKSYLVDINVWLALVYDRHAHHETVRLWFEQLEPGAAAFCRLTQIGLLRLLTNERVMGQDVRGQREAWRLYDRTAGDSRVFFQPEPSYVEQEFRRLTAGAHPSTNVWPDAYLAAVASAAGMAVATLDRGFRSFRGVDALCLLPDARA